MKTPQQAQEMEEWINMEIHALRMLPRLTAIQWHRLKDLELMLSLFNLPLN